jgi:cytochrome P450
MTQEAHVENEGTQTGPSGAAGPGPLDRLPVIPGATLLGHVNLFKDERHRLALLRNASATGGLSRMRFLYRWVLIVSSPESAREVLVDEAASFEKAPGVRVLLKGLAGDGLFTSEGAHWKSQRRLMSPLFHHSQLAAYTTAMNDVARHAVAGLRDGESLDLSRLMTRITMGVVGATLFGAETFESADSLGEALTTTLQWVDDNLASNYLTLQLSLAEALEKLRPRVPPVLEELQDRLHAALRSPVLLPGSRDATLNEAVRTLDRFVEKMIAERRANVPVGERVDLMTKLLLARDGEGEGSGHGEGMTDVQVRDEAMTLFVAGHETTANALSWAFYLLARDPVARARVQAEADAFGPEGVTQYDPAKLAYTTRVFKEALRMYPPLIMLGRRSTAPFTLAGEQYPAGVVCFVNTYGLHHDPSVWPDPDRFDPDRFLPEAEAARHKGAWMPFGVGPRVCIGNAFALMEGPIVMATLMRNLHVDINPARVIEPDAFATLRPKGGVPAVVRRR